MCNMCKASSTIWLFNHFTMRVLVHACSSFCNCSTCLHAFITRGVWTYYASPRSCLIPCLPATPRLCLSITAKHRKVQERSTGQHTFCQTCVHVRLVAARPPLGASQMTVTIFSEIIQKYEDREDDQQYVLGYGTKAANIGTRRSGSFWSKSSF